MLDLETIGVEFNTGGLEKGARAFAETEKAANRAADAVDAAGASASKAGAEYARNARAADDLSGTFQRLESGALKLSDAENRLVRSLVSEAKQIGMTNAERERYMAKQAGMSDAAAQMAGALRAKIDAYQSEIASIKAVTAEFDRLKRRQDSFLSAMQSQADTIGMTRRQLAEYQALQLGISDKAAPLIQRLYGADDALKKTGISAAQTAMAMRMLPMQMTDIVSGLATGQSPFMVLMQQGGQLKDMFGGIIPAAQAVGGTVLRFITNPITLAASAIAAMGYAAYKGQNEFRELENALTLSGNASAKTASHLDVLITKIGGATGSYSLARDAVMELTRSGKVSGDVFDASVSAVVNWSKATGESVSNVSKIYSDIAKDPAKAVLDLNEKYGLLSASIMFQVEALKRQGDEQEAVKLVQRSYAEESDAMAKRVIDNAGLIEKAWRGAKGAMEGLWQTMKDVGRPETDEERIDKDRQRLAFMLERGPVNNTPRFAAMHAQSVADLISNIADQQRQIDLNNGLAKSAAWVRDKEQDAAKALSELNSLGLQNATVTDKQTEALRKLAEQREKALGARGITPDMVAKIESDYARSVEVAIANLQPKMSKDQWLNAISQIESGQQQFWKKDGQGHKAGELVASGQGALGAYQILPKTGERWASQMGVEFNLEKLRQSADYGRFIAGIGYDLMETMFKGDKLKMAVAYHQGEGTVRKAVAAVGPGGDWLNATDANGMAIIGPKGRQYAKSFESLFSRDVQGNYVNGPMLDKESQQEQERLLKLQNDLAKATAELTAKQQGYTGSMVEFIGLKATSEFAAMSEAERQAIQSSAIAKANLDARAESWQKLMSATTESNSAQLEYEITQRGVVGGTREMSRAAVEFQKLQNSAQWGVYTDEVKKAIQVEFEATQSKRKLSAEYASARSLHDEADRLEEINKYYGMSAISVALLKKKKEEEALSTAILNGANAESIAGMKAQIAERERVIDAMKKAQANRIGDRLDEWARSSREQLTLYQEEARLSGLSALERAKVVAKREVELRLAKELADIEKNMPAGPEKDSAILKANDAAVAAREAAVTKVTFDAGTRLSTQIEQSLTDGIMRGFENGKGFAENFADTFKNMFKTMVLRPIVQAIVQPMVQPITGVVQGVVDGFNGSGGILGTANTANTIAGLGSTASAFGSGLGAGFSALGGEAGISGAMSAATTAMGAGNIAGGMGTAIGALGPYAALIAAFAALANTPASPHTGGASTAGAAVKPADLKAAFDGIDAKTQTNLDKLTGSSTALLNWASKISGGQGGYSVSAAYAADGRDAASGDLVIKRLDQVLSNWDSTRRADMVSARDFAMGDYASLLTAQTDSGEAAGMADAGPKIAAMVEDQWAQYLEAVKGDLMAQMQASGADIPAWARKMLAPLADVSAEDFSTELDKITKKIIALPETIAQQIGYNRDTVVSAWVDGLRTGDATAAGIKAADTFVSGIETQMLTSAAGKIQDIVFSGAIVPIVDSLMQGATLSQALAEANLDEVIKKAQAQAQAFAAVWGNADFQAALASIHDGYAKVMGDLGTTLNYTPVYTKSTQAAAAAQSDLAAAQSEATRAAEQEAQRLADLHKSLNGDLASLDIELLRRSGQSAAADAAARAKATEGYDAEALALYDLIAVRRAHIADLDAEASRAQQLDGLYAGIYAKIATPAERMAYGYERIAKSLQGAGLFAGQSDLASILAEASMPQVRDTVQKLWGESSSQTRLALLDAVGALADLKTEAASLADQAEQTALNLATQNANAAFAIVQRAIDAEKKAGQERLRLAQTEETRLKSLVDYLHGQTLDLYGQTDSTAQWMATQGQAYIDAALAGGALDRDKLGEAVSAIRATLKPDLFGSAKDMEFQTLVLAGKLGTLEQSTRRQLTAAQRALKAEEDAAKALDDLAQTQRDALDIARGQYTGILGVQDAIKQLSAAILAEKAISGIMQGSIAGSTYAPKTDTLHSAVTGLDYSGASIGGYLKALNAAGDNAGALDAYQQLTANGATSAMVSKLTGWSLDQINTWVDANNLPRFAGGGWHDGGWAMVGEQGPELAYMPPARIYNAGDTAAMVRGDGGYAELVTEVRALRAEVIALRRQVDTTNDNTARAADAVRTPRQVVVVADLSAAQ